MKHRSRLALCMVVFGSVLAGCTATAGHPDRSPTPSSSVVTPSPTEEAAAVATGPLVTLESTITFHLTEGPDWRITGDGESTIVIETNEIPEGADGFVQIDATQFPQISDDLDRMAETARDTALASHGFAVEIRDTRTVGGVEGYVLEGASEEAQYYEWGGLDSNNILTTMRFIVPRGLDTAEWIEPIMTSIQWQ